MITWRSASGSIIRSANSLIQFTPKPFSNSSIIITSPSLAKTNVIICNKVRIIPDEIPVCSIHVETFLSFILSRGKSLSSPTLTRVKSNFSTVGKILWNFWQMISNSLSLFSYSKNNLSRGENILSDRISMKLKAFLLLTSTIGEIRTLLEVSMS